MTLDKALFEPSQPGWWLLALHKLLSDRADRIKIYDSYYRGDQRLAFASERFRNAFGGLFQPLADNWTALVVDAVEERLTPQGFRIPHVGPDAGSSTSEDAEDAGDAEEYTEGDADAWRIWQENDLDAESQIAHTEALIHGLSSVLVEPGKSPTDIPNITIEHPAQMIVACAPGSRRKIVAALKEWLDQDGFVCATVYLPTEVYKFRSKTKQNRTSLTNDWVARDVPDEMWPLPNPLKVVPVVPLYNRPRLLVEFESEIASVIPMQDAANKVLADMLVASEYTAYRQRWATGLDLVRDPESGQVKEPFKHDVARLWQAEDPEVKFGEFGETNLEGYVKGIETIVQHIASQTRTPPHYFYLSGQFPSGESLRAAETGLVAKARRKMSHFGEGWEAVIRLAFRAMDDPRADVMDSETIWKDPETKTESEHIDALVKMQAIGVPEELLWEKAGLSPQEIRRIKEIRATQLPDQLAGVTQKLEQKYAPGVDPQTALAGQEPAATAAAGQGG